MKKFVLYSLVLFEILFSGCSSKDVQNPKNIEDIYEQKENKRFLNINIGNENKTPLKIFLSKDNKINYICTNKECNYEDDFSDEIIIYPNSFYPSFPINTKGVQCGAGSLSGFFILSSQIDMQNYSKQNKNLCENRFTKLDSTQIFDRVATGIVTLGTSLLTSGTMHTVKFDEYAFKDAIVKSNLDYFQKKLFEIKNLNSIKKGFDVIYLNDSDIKENLEDYYENLLQQKHTRDGLILIDENSKQILSIIDFKNYNSNDLIQNISNEIEDIFSNIKIDENELIIKESDVLSWIPKEIQKPNLPSIPNLQKSEFETKEEFKQRVLNSVKQREEDIKVLQKNYNLEILKRNEYISTLESIYNNYLNNIYNENVEIKKSLNENLEPLVKILFIQNLNAIVAKDFKYDAQTNRLYFEIYSNNEVLKNKAFAQIPVKIAKEIKENDSYYFEPIIDYKKGFVSLRGFEIIERNSENRYKINYTNIDFTPISQQVFVKTNAEKISDIEKNKEFTKLKQISSSIVENQKEYWYIDLVDTLNAKVPNWFSNPKISDEIISYASAPTYEEAKLKALNDLAMAKEVKISSTIKAQTQFDNRLKEYSNLEKNITAAVEKTFAENEYKVLNQEKVDGIWYISLIYTKVN
ncbi:hypothetical protein N5T57_10230 [Aliarcobacter cryaerophilus]|uniref:hypothetical protein n=1 Tax=Aliarcobacter cryaerophilus TaxID=28198 RepID=UPI0021B2713A|nr:hypothetical protein [Aliarcobacter cryaerophilus]MCT7523302.1 hypothetical protein [Aliarcobacter cryaerophilus]